MARSRSSFELTSAIATASTLAQVEKKPRPATPELAPYRGTGIVSFTADPGIAAPAQPHADAHADEGPVEDPPSTRPEDDEDLDEAPRRKSTPVLAIPPPPPSSSADPESSEEDAKPRPPKLPDLSSVVSPIVRCERIVEWIAEATGGTGVFIADADGLPVAGDIADAEARIGASGLVASSIATLLSALPGQPSPLFEVHIGEGPYFQLIGFTAAKGTYVVGLTRQTPLSPRQAHAIRLACRHAFGESLSGPAATGRQP